MGMMKVLDILQQKEAAQTARRFVANGPGDDAQLQNMRRYLQLDEQARERRRAIYRAWLTAHAAARLVPAPA